MSDSATIKVSAGAARRFLLLRSGLGRLSGAEPRWQQAADSLAAVRSLQYLQVDPMRVLECSHHLVLGARVGGYRPHVLDSLLYRSRQLAEVVARNRLIVPVEDLWLFRPRFAALEQANRAGLSELEPLMAKAMRRIEAEGPLSSLDFSDRETISGWWDPDGESRTRAVRQALEWLWHFGYLAVSHRSGTRRYFDLPERLFGGAVDPPAGITPAEAGQALFTKYCAAAGLVDVRDWSFGWDKHAAADRRALMASRVAQGEMIAVTVAGVKTQYYVLAAEAPDLVSAEGIELQPDIHFLPPLDNVIWQRPRLLDIFDFEYTWEAYTPAAARVYGPYTCPILVGDRIVGRIDARLERAMSTLVVNGLWWEAKVAGASGRPDDSTLGGALLAWAATMGADKVER